MRTGIEAYVHQVRHLFPFLGKKERTYLKKLQWTLEDCFGDQAPDTPEQVAQMAGKPEEVVSQYLYAMDAGEISKNIRRSHLWRLVRVGLLLVLFVVALLCVLWLWGYYQACVRHIQDITGFFITRINCN